MALVGEELEDENEICGAVVSLRTKVDRIQLWTRGKTDVERLNGIAKKMIKLLDVTEADNVGLEFQYNSSEHPPPNKFISMTSTFAFPQSGMRSTFPPQHGGKEEGVAPGPGPGGAPPAPVGGQGAMGAFGMGGGAFGWRKPR